MKKTFKILGRIILGLIALLMAFVLFTIFFHKIKTKKEISDLKGRGYYNPVSVGDYSLNVSSFGKNNGNHTVVGLAGLGMGDFSVSGRKMTESIEKDNLVVFVDRAGYGISEDTNKEMTNENIIEDYRLALKNAGVKPPYVLMGHSVGGMYASYWASKYPDEIEGVVMLDGSVCTDPSYWENTEEEGQDYTFLAKMGMLRYVLRKEWNVWIDDISDEDRRLSDALILMSVDSNTINKEDQLFAQNCKTAADSLVVNNVPKLYIGATSGLMTKEDVIEYNKWQNAQIEKYKLKEDLLPTEYDDNDEELVEILEICKRDREQINNYANKLGNCEIKYLPGNHAIYWQKPEECGKLVKDFIDGLN
ncbi:MAG: alpha/beta hydrolase [Eubacterium sp.]|nr:alpha/beta hydrolase [Eubacterium sp.]